MNNTILRDANLNGVRLSASEIGPSNMVSVILANASLVGTDLSNANMQNANLTGAILNDANLGDALLRNADLSSAVMNSADLTGVDFEGAKFDKTQLDRSSLGKQIHQENEGEYEKAKYIYLNLKKNFLDIGSYEAASWAYIRERVMQRKTYFPLYAKNFHFNRDVIRKSTNSSARLFYTVRFYFKYTLLWFRELTLGLFWGYGERPMNAGLFSIISILVFTLLYWYLGGFTDIPQRNLTLWDYFLHSLGSFATMPSLVPVKNAAKILTILEAFTGVTALAIFTSALGQRIGGR